MRFERAFWVSFNQSIGLWWKSYQLSLYSVGDARLDLIIFLFLVKIRRRRRKKKAEMFPVGLMRVGYREYDVGVLFLIISSQFVTSFTTSSTSSPKTTKTAEILSRKTTRYVSTSRKSQQANNSHISGFTTTFFPTSVIENRNSVNASLVKRRRCSRERNEDCPKFVDRYSSFYLKVGLTKCEVKLCGF